MIVRELLGRLGLAVDPTGFDIAERLFDKSKRGLAALGAVAGGMALGIAGAIGTAAARAGDISDLAERTGVAAETLQALDFGAKLAGVEVGELAQSLGALSKGALAATKGGGEAQKAWAKTGVSLRDSNGDLKTADALMVEVADTFAGMPEGVEKTALAMQLFGRSGAGLLPFLNQGGAKIAELRDEAVELGAVMSEETIKAGDELGDNFGRLTEGLKGLRNLIIGPLFKPMADFVERLVQWMRVNNELIAAKVTPWLKAMGRGLGLVAKLGMWIVDTFGKAALAVGAFFLAWKLGTLLMSVTKVWETVTWGIALSIGALRDLTWAQLKSAAAGALQPLIYLALAAAIVLAYDEYKAFMGGGKSLLGKFGQQWTNFLDKFLKVDADDWFITRWIKQAIQALFDLHGTFLKVKSAHAGLVVEKQTETQRLQNTYDAVPDEGFAGFWKRYVMIRPSSEPMDTAAAFGGGATPSASIASSPGMRGRAGGGATTITVGPINVTGTENPEATAELVVGKVSDKLATDYGKTKGARRK